MIGGTVDGGNQNTMETDGNWNVRIQNLVRISGCDAVLHALKTYEEQSPQMPTSMVGDGDSTMSKHQERKCSSVSLPWMERFANKTSVKPSTTSTIISQLNSYHRRGSTTGTNYVPVINWNVKNNKVTPPSGAVKSSWEEPANQTSSMKNAARKHPGTPPPLLLAGSNHAFTGIVGGSSVSATTATTKQFIYLPMKKGVPHVYHDFSDIPDAMGVARKKTGGVTQPFPEKLHTMLDNDDDPSIVSWLSHGRAFLVRKPAEFTAQIMPK